MDATIYLRLLAHTLGIGLVVAMIIVLAFALYYGWSIRISHIPLAIGALTLLCVWLLFLLLSIRDIALVPREALATLLGSLELGGFVLGWAWFIFMIKSNFRFTLRWRTRRPSPC